MLRHDGAVSRSRYVVAANIADTSLQEAYDRLCDMYEDPNSDLGKVCAKCQWWVMWSDTKDGDSPYMRTVRFDQAPPPSEEPLPPPSRHWLAELLTPFRRS